MTEPATAPRSGATAVFVCEELPVPGTSGSATYNAGVLRGLADLGFAVRVVVTGVRIPTGRPRSCDGAADVVHLHARRRDTRLVPTSWPALARRVQDLLGAPRRHPAESGGAHPTAYIGRDLTRRDLARLRRRGLGRPDLLVVDTIFRAAALDVLGAERTLLVAHDDFTARTASFRRNGYDVVPVIDEGMERARIARFDAVLAINADDATTLGRLLAPGSRIDHLLPAVEEVEATVPRTAEAADLLYLGSAAYHNVDGLRWFLQSVWPAVHRSDPGRRLHVVGDVGATMPQTPGVQVHGRVEDLRAVAAACAFAVNPVLMGSGIKVKMVDYLRHGLPCLVTPAGADGLPASPARPFEVCEDADAMIAAVGAWCASPGLVAEHRARIPRYLEAFSATRRAEVLGALVHVAATV